MPTRRYDDPCGIARALDAVGDRWALLVVRELIFGQKRFSQLRDGLYGVSPNVLSQRLRDLEDGGLVRRDALDPPAGVAVYKLTPRGLALEPILLELGRWGSQQPLPAAGELSASAVLLALKTVFEPADDVNAIVALRIDGDWFRVTIAAGSIDIVHGRSSGPAVTAGWPSASAGCSPFRRSSRPTKPGRQPGRGLAG